MKGIAGGCKEVNDLEKNEVWQLGHVVYEFGNMDLILGIGDTDMKFGEVVKLQPAPSEATFR